jgi:hypothetical protein
MNATKSATTSMPRTNGTAFQAMFKTGVLVSPELTNRFRLSGGVKS